MLEPQYEKINNDFVKFNKNLRFEMNETSMYKIIIFDWLWTLRFFNIYYNNIIDTFFLIKLNIFIF